MCICYSSANPHKTAYNYDLLKGHNYKFLSKKVVLGVFQTKSESIHLLVVFFCVFWVARQVI